MKKWFISLIMTITIALIVIPWYISNIFKNRHKNGN